MHSVALYNGRPRKRAIVLYKGLQACWEKPSLKRQDIGDIDVDSGGSRGGFVSGFLYKSALLRSSFMFTPLRLLRIEMSFIVCWRRPSIRVWVESGIWSQQLRLICHSRYVGLHSKRLDLLLSRGSLDPYLSLFFGDSGRLSDILAISLRKCVY